MKTIKLSSGKVATVDDSDYPKLSRKNWWYNGRYAVRQIREKGRKKNVYIHREVMGNPHGLEVDHINGDSLDNRKSNLRVCTHAENLRNMKKGPMRGVRYDKRFDSYYVNVTKNYKRYYVGAFKNRREAILAAAEARERLYELETTPPPDTDGDNPGGTRIRRHSPHGGTA